ncbi:sugar phosphate isomerase/epimerase family protein [Granulicella arctica]|uniref:Sugar phosphate isomerase/epimerase n=1 Tax=Granulicella arctica TaxID=940613 RepID=A0A7Y9PFB1_9BACT|nr:sugar phosphate isomerase/epimerase [Granulicella arctica]NYF78096.1 sugar phosphate isomerase/epimerase [Granulicella arctica]
MVPLLRSSRISRRRFLQGATAATVGVASQGLRALSATDKIGIQLYTVGEDLQRDVPGTLRKLRSIGYTQVETAGFAGLTAKEFRTHLDDAGLTCRSMHLPLGDHPLDPLFEDAQTMGAHFAVSSVLFSLKTSPDKLSIDDYRAMAERANDLGSKAKQAGLRYAYHNHNVEFRVLDGGGIGYDILLKQTDPALVDFEMDCGWVVAAGHSPVSYFHDYPHRYKMLHIKDFVAGSRVSTSLAKGERPQGTELGRGHIDYKPILDAAAKAGIYDYYIEQEPPFPDMKPLEAAKIDYDYLNGLK